MLPKSLVEERNDNNNKDDTPDVQCHAFDCLKSDDHNKKVLKKSSSCGSDWSKECYLDFKANGTSSCEDIMQYLLISICCQVFCCQVFCCQQQAYSGTATYKYTVCLMVATSVYFNVAISLTFTVSIQHWKELCDLVVQYWREAFYTLMCCYLRKLFNVGVQQRKKPWTVTHRHYQSLCSAPSPTVMPQCCVLTRSALNCATCLSIANDESLDSLYGYAILCVMIFGNFLSDVMLLLCDAPMKLSPMLALGLFPNTYNRMYHIKSCNEVGRQAGDRNGGNGKRSQNESSKQSGSAGSNANSSTTGGTSYAGRTGLASGVNGGAGDHSGGDDGDDKDWRWHLEKPWDAVWEENGDEDKNRDCSTVENSPADTAPKNTSGQYKIAKASNKMAKPILYEHRMKCEKGLYMFMVTSPMMNNPVSGDDLGDQSTHDVLTVKDNTICIVHIYEVNILYAHCMHGNFCGVIILCY